MVNRITLLWILSCVILFSSCVSKKKYQAAVADASASKATNADLTKKNSDLQNQLNEAIQSNKLLTDEHNKLQEECERTKKQYEEVKANVNEVVAAMEAVQKKLEAGMADFADRGVNTEYKNGLVYVNFTDELLYKSGSSKVSKDGETALANLATVLNDYPNLKVYVVGNTDDRKMKGGDNWTLSTERANNVVRILKKLKVDPARLIAGGKAEFDPVADNTTEEGRAQNRRTQIIINPDVMKVLEKHLE